MTVWIFVVDLMLDLLYRTWWRVFR